MPPTSIVDVATEEGFEIPVDVRYEMGSTTILCEGDDE